MGRVNPGTPNLHMGQQPQPLADSHSLCTHLYVTKAKGSPPVPSAFDKVLNPQSPLLQSPRAEHAQGQFLGWGAMAHSALGTVGCRQVLLSWALLHGQRSAGDTSESPTAEVMSCPSSAGAFLISWVCQVLMVPCTDLPVGVTQNIRAVQQAEGPAMH